MHIYNDNDPASCDWLEELIKQNHLPYGHVCPTSITELQPASLTAYTQVHLFAGIGGWPYALRLAGWPNDMPVWTGSCPCQPFSCAGRQLGTADSRHLWPHMLRLIIECRPPVVFGEQVASKTGREWLSEVRTDLETLGYAVGATRLPAACIGAKHFRYRLFFVAHSMCKGLEGLHKTGRQVHLQSTCQIVPGHNWQATPRVLSRVNGFSRKLDRPPFYKEQIVGYGNAIVPQLAAEFIAASVEAINDCYHIIQT